MNTPHQPRRRKMADRGPTGDGRAPAPFPPTAPVTVRPAPKFPTRPAVSKQQYPEAAHSRGARGALRPLRIACKQRFGVGGQPPAKAAPFHAYCSGGSCTCHLPPAGGGPGSTSCRKKAAPSQPFTQITPLPMAPQGRHGRFTARAPFRPQRVAPVAARPAAGALLHRRGAQPAPFTPKGAAARHQRQPPAPTQVGPSVVGLLSPPHPAPRAGSRNTAAGANARAHAALQPSPASRGEGPGAPALGNLMRAQPQPHAPRKRGQVLRVGALRGSGQMPRPPHAKVRRGADA